MAKKSFKDKPALHFISSAEEDKKEEQEEEKKEKQEVIQQTKTPTPEKAPDGYKRNPLYIEVKSRRLQLVLQPSLFDKVKRKAEKNGLSVNEYIHRVLEKDVKEE